MDNNPDKKPNDPNTDPKQNEELTPTPSYEQEPATGGQGGSDSPFGPPISNVGSTSPGVSPDQGNQPISDVTPPTSSPNIKSGATPVAPPVVNDSPSEPVGINPDAGDKPSPSTPGGEQPDFGGSMSDTGAANSDTIKPVGSPGVESATPDATAQNDVAVDPVTAESVAPTAASGFAAKKKRTGLWVTLISVFVVLALLAGGYFYLKTQADSTASEYTENVKTYLTEVETAGANMETDPVGAASQISELTRPTLGPAMAEFVSSEYSEAVQLQKDVDAKVSAVLSKVVDVQNQLEVPDFVEEYEAKIAEGEEILAETEEDDVDEAYLAYLQELQTLVEDAALPESLDDSKAALSAAIDEEVAIYTDRTSEETDTESGEEAMTEGEETTETTEEETTETPTLEEVREDKVAAFAEIEGTEEAAVEAVDSLTQEAVAALEDLRTFRAGL